MGRGRVQWSGVGRWLSFAVAAVLIVTAIPEMSAHALLGAWDLFLGLLLVGAVVSGYRQTPSLVGVLTAMMVLRLFFAMFAERNAVVAGIDALLLVPLFIAWRDFRRQAASLGVQDPR
jgi:hypothetical protein